MKKLIIFISIFLFFGCDMYRYNQLNKPIVIVALNRPTQTDTLGSIMFKDALNYYSVFYGKNRVIRAYIKYLNVGDTIR